MFSRSFSAVMAAGLTLATTAGLTRADDHTGVVSVIHAIPNLPAPVDVLVDGAYQFSFDYKDQVGPIELPEGTYELEVQLMGTPVLNASATVEGGGSYTAIAHLTFIDGMDSGIALSLFENDDDDLEPGSSRVSIRHTANAPAVDIDVFRGRGDAPRLLMLTDLSNNDGEEPTEAGPAAVRPGGYSVQIFAAGTDTLAFETRAKIKNGRRVNVYAIGSIFDGSFELLVEERKLQKADKRLSRGDLNGDAVIDSEDLIILLQLLGQRVEKRDIKDAFGDDLLEDRGWRDRDDD